MEFSLPAQTMSLQQEHKALGLETDEKKINSKNKFLYWFGTCFCGHTLDEAKALWIKENADKWAAQLEVCPETKRPHLQYIVRWTRACTRGTKTKGGHKRRMGCDCFCTPVKGTQSQIVYHYCTKARSRVEGSTAITHGFDGPATTEIGWEELVQLIREGKTWDDLLTQFPEILKYRKQVQDEIEDQKAKRGENPERKDVTVIVFTGVSHSGKTTMAAEMAKDYASEMSTEVQTLGAGQYKRFPREYKRQKVVHFKEFQWSSIGRRQLLTWMEPGAATVDVLYKGIQPFHGEVLIFDTTDHPKTWYKKYYENNQDKLEPELLGRINEIITCKKIPLDVGRKRKREDDDLLARMTAKAKRRRAEKLAEIGVVEND